MSNIEAIQPSTCLYHIFIMSTVTFEEGKDNSGLKREINKIGTSQHQSSLDSESWKKNESFGEQKAIKIKLKSNL